MSDLDTARSAGAATAVDPATVDPAAPPGPGALSPRQIRLVFGGLMLGMLLAALDQTIVSTALPTIVGDLGGLNHLSWVVTSYLLASTVSTPLWGKLGDLYGRKRFFQAAIVIFLIGSALSGLSQNLNELIAFRALQGLGAGGLIVGAQAIIGDIVPPRERGRYTGLIGAVFAVSSVAGPLLGGFFTDGPGWRWVFYINLPIGAIALVVVAAVLHAKVTTRVEHKIDYLGTSVMASAVVCLILLLTWGGTTYAWTSGTIIGLGVASLALFGAFIAVEQHVEEPIVPLHLFKNPVFRVAFATSAIVGFSMFGALTFLPLFLQVVHGASATSSGLQLIPIMAFVLATAILSGRRISATGTYRRFPIAGTALVSLALFLLSHLGVHTPFWQTAIFMAVLGAGLGLTMQTLLLAAQNSVAYRELGVATATATFSRSIGGSIGVAVFGTIFNSRLKTNLPKQVRLIPRRELTTPVRNALSNLHGTSVTANPVALKHQPAVVRDVVRFAFSDSLHVVFLAAVPFAVLAFVLALMLREVPLRTSMAPANAGQPAASEGKELGEALGMAPAPDLDGEIAAEHESLAPDAVAGPSQRT
jgi:EmrB/QacA subfamily drug resistance transporter